MLSTEAFVRDIEQNGWNVYGFEVYTDGKLTFSYGDTETNRHPIYSATKSVTSIAVGCAVDDGRFDISAPLLRYIPDEFVREMPSVQREIYNEHITVERLLTMSVPGYPFRRPECESWLRFSLGVPLPNAAERLFDYGNLPAYLVGVAVSNAVGRNLYEYLDERLFSPLGISAPPCIHCPDGYFYGASGMELTVNELSRIGLMLQNGGVYDGRRIVSEDYVREATSIKQMNREGGYGYYFWKYRSGFSINGKHMQKCYILPGSGVMVTMLSDIEDQTQAAAVRASMEQNVPGIM